MKHLLLIVCTLILLSGCSASKKASRNFPAAVNKSVASQQPTANSYTPPVVIPPDLTPSEQRQFRKNLKAESKAKARELVAQAKVEAAKQPRKIKNSAVATGAGANAGKNDKNATGATGQGATATSIDRAKEQVAVGDSIKQTNAEKKAVAGEDIQITQEPEGFKWWLIAIPAALFCLWRLVAKTAAYKRVPWLPSEYKWVTVGIVFIIIIYFLLRYFA